MTHTPIRAAACAAVVIFAGCSKALPAVHPAGGVVRLNGQPLPNAQLQLVPTRPGVGVEYIATATTDDQGRFQLSCNGRPGACAGENRVTVLDGPLPDKVRGNQTEEARFAAGLKNRPIPEPYTNLARSPLAVTVTPDQAEYVLELTR